MQVVNEKNGPYSVTIEIPQDLDCDVSQFWNLQLFFRGTLSIHNLDGVCFFSIEDVPIVEFVEHALAWILKSKEIELDFNCYSDDEPNHYFWIRKVEDQWMLGSDVLDLGPHPIEISAIKRVLWQSGMKLYDYLIDTYGEDKLSKIHQQVIRRYRLSKLPSA